MPAPTITTAEIETRIRRRADMENSDFIGTAELTQYAEKAWQEFYGILVAKEPDLCTTSASISLAAGDTDKDLAAGFKSLRLIRHATSYALRRAELGQLTLFDSNNQRGKPTHYWLHGGGSGAYKLRFLPTPDTAYTMTVYYVPSLSLADITSGFFNIVAGWDEYVVLTGAAKCKDKEESDVSVLLGERKLLLEHIMASITAPDQNEPPTVQVFGSVDPFDLEERYGLW